MVVGDNDGAGLGVKNAGAKGIPAVLIGAVSVHDDEPRHLRCRPLFRPVDDGGHAEAVSGGVGHPLGHDTGCDFELPEGFGLERWQGIGNEQGRFDPVPLLVERRFGNGGERDRAENGEDEAPRCGSGHRWHKRL